MKILEKLVARLGKDHEWDDKTELDDFFSFKRALWGHTSGTGAFEIGF